VAIRRPFWGHFASLTPPVPLATIDPAAHAESSAGASLKAFRKILCGVFMRMAVAAHADRSRDTRVRRCSHAIDTQDGSTVSTGRQPKTALSSIDFMHTTPGSLLHRLRRPQDPTVRQDAWSRFVQLYSPLIYGWARRSGAPRHEALDLVQDVLTILVQKLPAFDYEPHKSFRAWLRTVTLNRFRELRRKEHFVVQAGDALLAEVPNPDNACAFEDEDYHRYLVGRALKLMQAEFQPTTWKACWEHVVSDRTAAEVARELGISEGAVYVAKYRVLRRLRVELRDLLD
jgi:RNA polymerase sigma-70 factor (ECF subfamily)